VNFSVLIPSFNDIRIIETIESIKAQKLNGFNVEIVVQDGGSKEDIVRKI